MKFGIALGWCFAMFVVFWILVGVIGASVLAVGILALVLSATLVIVTIVASKVPTAPTFTKRLAATFARHPVVSVAWFGVLVLGSVVGIGAHRARAQREQEQSALCDARFKEMGALKGDQPANQLRARAEEGQHACEAVGWTVRADALRAVVAEIDRQTEVQKAAQRQAQREQADAEREAKRAAANRQVNVGEEFKLGKFTYLIKEIWSASTVGSGYAGKTASDGAVFVVVRFSIRNDGNETETVMADDFRIIDAKKREFHPSSEANTALVMSGGKDMILSQLQPGVKKDSATAFEVPEAVVCNGYDLVIPEKGFLGSGKVVISNLRAKCRK
jgi:predicted SnoaL-like aldol condensation-catalyzing enzyme